MKVVISGGGTGGHLYPALSVAIALKKRHDDVIFIGAKDRIEEKVVPTYNLNFYALDVIGYKKSVKGKFDFLLKQIGAIKQAKKIISDFKPDVVIGWGGYASFATLTAAKLLKIPTIIHEQNAIMGRANYLLSLQADKVLTCYPNIMKKAIMVGNPRSSEAIKFKNSELKLRKMVLFVMGSQGSSTVNELINDYLAIRNKHYDVTIICGKGHTSLFDKAHLSCVKLLEFSNESLKLFNQADLVVTRGGATTLEELATLGKPTIIVPSPFVYKNHQYQNALYYKKNDATILIKEKDLTKDKLKYEVESLINSNIKLETLSHKISSLSHPRALYDILKIIDIYDKH
jgi:UDP-N-acetylglucosamine--N-acetylmuramyl-(pentapeptide) pyrophosphoryl-undecaprenol N-acetylglucosamine transferase